MKKIIKKIKTSFLIWLVKKLDKNNDNKITIEIDLLNKNVIIL